jgi:hypothetical protein
MPAAKEFILRITEEIETTNVLLQMIHSDNEVKQNAIVKLRALLEQAQELLPQIQPEEHT